jgi:hypothetical protein
MIADQTIVSARAEKRKTAVESRFIRRLIAAYIATALTMPALAAWGMNSPYIQQPSDHAAAQITLPPIPYLDSIPWMKWEAGIDTLKTDILLSPTPGPSWIKLTPEEYAKLKPPTS